MGTWMSVTITEEKYDTTMSKSPLIVDIRLPDRGTCDSIDMSLSWKAVISAALTSSTLQWDLAKLSDPTARGAHVSDLMNEISASNGLASSRETVLISSASRPHWGVPDRRHTSVLGRLLMKRSLSNGMKTEYRLTRTL